MKLEQKDDNEKKTHKTSTIIILMKITNHDISS